MDTLPPNGPGIGHNTSADPVLNPDLLALQWESDHADLFERRDALLAAQGAFFAKYPRIEDEETQAKAAELVAQMKASAKQAEATRTIIKRPYADVALAADALFKRSTTDALLAAARELEEAQTAYARVKAAEFRRQQAEEAERQRRAAEEAAAEAARLRAEVEQQPTKMESLFGLDTVTAPVEDAGAAAAADELERTAEIAAAEAARAERNAQASNADAGRTRSAMGAVASLRDNWTFELVDITQVPARYLVLNDKLIRAEVKALKDKCEIPGIRVFNDPQVRSNAR